MTTYELVMFNLGHALVGGFAGIGVGKALHRAEAWAAKRKEARRG